MEFFKSPQFYLPIIYVVIGVFLIIVIKKIVSKGFDLKANTLRKNSHNYKKTETIKVLVQNIIGYFIGAVVILSILGVYGVDVGSLIAGLGILGAVVGLAFQDTLKDLFAGVSIILENHYAIGDNIEINGFRGEVIFLGLKTTKIKSYDGAVMMVANRNVSEVINYSIEESRSTIDISISYDENTDKVLKVLNEIADTLNKELTNTKGKVEVLGIEKLADSAVIYRMTVPTVAMENFGISRKMNKEIKDRLDEAHIPIVYPQIEVHHGE